MEAETVFTDTNLFQEEKGEYRAAKTETAEIG
jgi:hypothetical protein